MEEEKKKSGGTQRERWRERNTDAKQVVNAVQPVTVMLQS